MASDEDEVVDYDFSTLVPMRRMLAASPKLPA
jgi:hypothetical protein